MVELKGVSLVLSSGRFLIFILLSLGFACLPASAREIDKIANTEFQDLTIATVDYPPLMGLEGGIMTDLVKAAFETQAIRVKYEIYPVAKIAWSILEGRDIPVVGSVGWFHVDLQKMQLHSVQLYSGNLHLFYLKRKFPDGLRYQNLNDLRQFSIGYIHGGSLIPLFADAGVHPQLVNNLEQNVKKVYAERIDMFAAMELGGWAMISRNFSDYAHEFEMAENPIHRVSGDAIFPPSQQHLKAVLEKGVAEIRSNGDYVKIYQRYYGDRPLPKGVVAYRENGSSPKSVDAKDSKPSLINSIE